MTITSPSSQLKNLYEEDFNLWIEYTIKLLKETRFEKVDLDNLIEEIEAMGRREKRELESRLITIIEHLLKLQYWTAEKEDNQRGWRITVIEQRRKLNRLLKDSPSLNRFLEDIFLECYQTARQDTLKKYDLSSAIFPVSPPFTVKKIINTDYLP
ncbi:MAG TPA: DUF29 domain-containing protein [Cyanothece sp. UBA12306]|nr:DUF29 domain-containing protein [Cyanothece sp. UBA12306]